MEEADFNFIVGTIKACDAWVAAWYDQDGDEQKESEPCADLQPRPNG